MQTYFGFMAQKAFLKSWNRRMFPTEEINGSGVDRKRFLVVPRCVSAAPLSY